MEKDKIKTEVSMSYDDAVMYLENLVSSFKAGSVVVETAEGHVALTPPAEVKVEVSARRKKDKEKVALELSWTNVPAKEDVGLKISDTVPEPTLEASSGAEGEAGTGDKDEESADDAEPDPADAQDLPKARLDTLPEAVTKTPPAVKPEAPLAKVAEPAPSATQAEETAPKKAATTKTPAKKATAKKAPAKKKPAAKKTAAKKTTGTKATGTKKAAPKKAAPKKAAPKKTTGGPAKA